MSTPRALVLYSNPAATARLRLDQEHRAIDQALATLHLDPTTVRRLHAVTLDDFAGAIRQHRYEVVHFSGHGERNGILLEGGAGASPELVSARRLASVLRAGGAEARVLMCVSCFSSETLGELAGAAPYVITVQGPVHDDAATQFVAGFYSSYLRDGYVETAYRVACDVVAYEGLEGGIQPVLTRRATLHGRPADLCVAPMKGDSVLVDLTPVADDLRGLGELREHIISLLTRKMRVHRWIFESPKERALLSIGPYFGVFSWKTADDPIVCHRLLRLRPGVSEDACRAWADLIVTYNDLWASPHRAVASPGGPEQARRMERASREFRHAVERFFEDTREADLLRSAAGEQFVATRVMVLAHARQAEECMAAGESGRALAHWEAVLTSVHDLVDDLAERLATPLRAEPSSS